MFVKRFRLQDETQMIENMIDQGIKKKERKENMIDHSV